MQLSSNNFGNALADPDTFIFQDLLEIELVIPCKGSKGILSTAAFLETNEFSKLSEKRIVWAFIC